MTDAVRELFEMLAKKEKSGSDYTGRVTRVEGGTAYVQFDGSDIPNTPVALSIGAKAGDEVRIRVADGKAWIVGNDTNPPTDDSAAQEVAEEMVDMRTRVTGLQGQYTEIQRTADNISTIVSDGDKLVSVINQSAGEVLIQAEKINLDGYTKITAGELGGFVTVKGDTGCQNKTTANGGHRYPTSLYKQLTDGTYEYEVGIKGDGSGNTPAKNLAFYLKRMTAGDVWSNASDMFYVNNSGKLYTKNAEIDDVLKITKGTMTAQLDGAELKFTDSRSAFSNYTNKISGVSISTWNGNKNAQLSNGEFSSASSDGNAYTNIYNNCVEVGYADGTYNRNGRFTASSAGNIGLYDIPNANFIIYSDSAQTVHVPHPLDATSVTTYNGNYKPVGSYGTDGVRVGYISARLDSSNFQFRVNGQWGDTGDNYSVKTIWSSSVSDIRLKQNIENTDVNGLDAVNQMRMRQFDWIRDGKHQPIGFVADELETIDPDLALGGGYDEDGNIDEKQVNTYMVVAYLTKAVQELSAKVEELENKLSTMEDKNHGHS